MQVFSIIILGFFLLNSCTGYKVHKYPELADEPYKEDIVVSGEHVSFYGKSAEDQLKYAKHLSGERRYDEALKHYKRIYENKSFDVSVRSEALYLTAETYENVLFSGHNSETSLSLFQRFLEEFPESELVNPAKLKITELEKLIKLENEIH